MKDDNQGIVDAWAQPALKEGLRHMPEIEQLLKQSGSSSVLETGMTAEQMVEETHRTSVAELNSALAAGGDCFGFGR